MRTSEDVSTESVSCRDRGVTIVFSAAGGNVLLQLRGQDGTYPYPGANNNAPVFPSQARN